MAYARIEPWGQWRDDVRAGVVASVIANVHRARGQQAFSPLDFLLFQPKKPRSAAEQIAAAKANALLWQEAYRKREQARAETME